MWGKRKIQSATLSPNKKPTKISMPRHIAIIMDGNGRWAEERGKSRIFGHREGAKRVDEIVTECANLGVEYLTLYTFSTENWSRPAAEVNLLMRLLVENLKTMDKKLIRNKISLVAQGTLERLPGYVQKELKRVAAQTKLARPKMSLSLALSYGGRQEIIDASLAMARDLSAGKLDPAQITEEIFERYLYHPDFPAPELMIRTGGDCRVSNFLLWQVAYSELVILEDYWPDFKKPQLVSAIEEYSRRQRRFGKTGEQVAQRPQRPQSPQSPLKTPVNTPSNAHSAQSSTQPSTQIDHPL